MAQCRFTTPSIPSDLRLTMQATVAWQALKTSRLQDYTRQNEREEYSIVYQIKDVQCGSNVYLMAKLGIEIGSVPGCFLIYLCPAC